VAVYKFKETPETKEAVCGEELSAKGVMNGE
jgi:hypothetical protein